MPSALVIGGGFAGATAAARLSAAGVRVTLLDDRAVLGGRARSDDLDGVTIDVGAQLVTSSFARTIRLLQPAGGGDASRGLRRTPGRDVFVRDGARLPIQFGSVRNRPACRPVCRSIRRPA